MVNAVNSGVQSYPTSQPSFVTGAETRANTEQVQPRQAPAAESQRNDQRLASRNEDNRRSEDRAAEQRAQARAESDQRDQVRAERRRGESVDVTV